MRTLDRRELLLGLASASALSAAAPANWPQFRGAAMSGVAEADPKLPERWGPETNIAWKASVPGRGWGSPVVWGERIFVVTCVAEGEVEPLKKGLYFGGNRLDPPTDPHRWMTYCLDRTSGEILWSKTAHRGAPQTPRHLKNSYASETPAVDDQRVYAHFGNLGTYCYDFEGELLWSRSWPPREMRSGWGTAASPALHQGRLYLVNDSEGASSLSALEAATGKTIWQVERDEPSNWATPFVWDHAGRTEIVVPGRNKLRSYDLDGKELWAIGGMSSIVIPTPFTAHGLLYVASGYVGDEVRPVFAVKPGAQGDISLEAGQTTNEQIVWHLPQGGPYNPSPLVYGDYYYTLYDRGFLTCHDAKTGREVYGKQRFEVGASAFSASPWAYNGKVFCLSEDGDCFVVEAGPEYKLLAKNSLGELCMSTPAMTSSGLVLRTDENLYLIQG